MANASRGCPRRVRQVSGPEPTVGRQRGQIAQLLGGLQRSWAAQSWAEKLGSPSKKQTFSGAVGLWPTRLLDRGRVVRTRLWTDRSFVERDPCARSVHD